MEHLPSKNKVLSSNPIYSQKRKKRKGRKGGRREERRTEGREKKVRKKRLFYAKTH
jgi:hypothetical protein